MVPLTGFLAVRVQAVLTATSTVTATAVPVAPVKAVEVRARRRTQAAGAREWGGASRCSKDYVHVSQNGL